MADIIMESPKRLRRDKTTNEDCLERDKLVQEDVVDPKIKVTLKGEEMDKTLQPHYSSEQES